MGYQRQSQTRKPQAYSQPQGEKRANYSPHPIEELQGWIGNRAMGRMLQAQPMSQGSMLRKPLFRGLSHEWEGKKQQREIPVQAQLDETVKEGSEERAQVNSQPSMGVRKPLFRGLSYELMEDLAQRGMSVQAKLMVGKADDRFEEEADRVAAAVVQQIDGQTPQPLSQGETVQREEMEEERLQRKPSVASLSVVEGGMAAPAELERAIQGARGSGQPLAESVREPMEREFGADFTGVRVHTDAQSDELNQSLSSRAFTTGEDIFFRQGEYEPGSSGGQELLAHELTHVVQQGDKQSQIQLNGEKKSSVRYLQSQSEQKNGEIVIQLIAGKEYEWVIDYITNELSNQEREELLEDPEVVSLIWTLDGRWSIQIMMALLVGQLSWQQFEGYKNGKFHQSGMQLFNANNDNARLETDQERMCCWEAISYAKILAGVMSYKEVNDCYNKGATQDMNQGGGGALEEYIAWIEVGHWDSELAQSYERAEWRNIAAGALIFIIPKGKSQHSNPDHVGLAIGNGEVLHLNDGAPMSRTTINDGAPMSRTTIEEMFEPYDHQYELYVRSDDWWNEVEESGESEEES